ncbi:MAG TPA: hypothetical protein VG934_03330 [Candidatus Paceibacterota bacterium]|nr:hypothetical protein [Candidatus Paceibacterota bacterium]
MSRTQRAIIRIIVTLLGIGIVVAALWYGIQFFTHHSSSNTNVPFGQMTTPPVQQAPAGYKEYHSDLYRFSIIYPDDLAFLAYPEAAGGGTFTFENDSQGRGFQVYVTPFQGSQITDERFKADDPSGVRDNLQNITVDGAVGASFYGKDKALGDTAEIWFLREGYLYEVTTLKATADLLTSVMQTWKFY